MSEHTNPIDESDVTDEERAEMLEEYLECFADEFGEIPKLMPLDDEGKAPIIQGRCKLDTDEARGFLVEGEEAVRQIREEGARGFAIYAGKPEHNTDDAVLVDHDDLEAFPTPTGEPTLEVLSGSGRGKHETYRNADGVGNAKATGEIKDAGEVRAHNWYCVTPGSIHPTGGVYHIAERREIAELATDDLRSELTPSTGTTEGGSDSEPVELSEPEELADKEENDFTNAFEQSLAEIREIDDRLDDLLTDLEPSGYGYPSTSEADAAAVKDLYYWRFDKTTDIPDIIRKYRNRPKVRERDDYIQRTIANIANGEQCDPPRDHKQDDDVKAEALEAHLLKWEDSDDDPEFEDRQTICELLGEVEAEVFDEYRDRAAEVLDVPDRVLDEHRDRYAHREERGPFLVEDGKTYYLTGVPIRKVEVLNFEIDVNSFLETPGEGMKADVELVLSDGSVIEEQVGPEIFKKHQRFKDELLSLDFGLSFDPSEVGADADELLDLLSEYIRAADAPVRTGTRHIGLHGEEWVTPHGTLTADGWTDDPDHVYLDREIGLERRVNLTPELEEPDEEDVSEIITQLPKTRDTQRFLPVLAWFYAAPFAPLIREWGRSGFNILNVTGGTGSGKTTTLRYLWRCFGMAGEPFDATDTWFVLINTYGSSNALPVWHDEYKPSDMGERDLNQFHDALRKTATGSVAQRGRADGGTDDYEMKAPAVVSGEQQIQRPAERRRSVMVNFRKETTDQGTDTRRAFKELIGSEMIEDGELKVPEDAPDPTHHALAYYRWAVDRDERDLRERWQDARRELRDHRQEWDADIDLDDMEIQGLQTVLFGWDLYTSFAEKVGVDSSELPTADELDGALRHVADAVGDGGRKSHLDKFVELLGRAAAAGYLKDGVHYHAVREGDKDEELRIHTPTAYDAVSRYARDHDLNEDLLGAEAYRDRFEEAEAAAGGYVISYGAPTYPPGKRCEGILTLEAQRTLDFSRSSFGLEPLEIEEAEGEADDDGGGSGDPEPTADEGGATPAAADGGEVEADDGGPPEEVEGLRADAQRAARVLRDAGAVVGEEPSLDTWELSERLDMSVGRMKEVLEHARYQMNPALVAQGDPDEWRAVD